MEKKLILLVVTVFLLTATLKLIHTVTGSKLIGRLYHITAGGLVLGIITTSVLLVLIFSELRSTTDHLENTDYAVILGAGLIGDQVSGRLQVRLDTAIALLEDTDIPIIVSGGQGPDEDISEAEAMKRYLQDKGISEERVILEDQSTSTQENILFSNQLMSEKDKHVVIITSDYHMYRSKMLGKRIGWDVSGESAINPPKSTARRSFREVFALAKDLLVRTF